jgi:hypothetical protein
MNKFTGLFAAVGLLCLAPGLASANAIPYSDNEDNFSGDYYGGGSSGFYAGQVGDEHSVISYERWYAGSPDYGFYHRKRPPQFPHPPTTSVPEPGSTTLIATGLLLLGFAAYRRQRISNKL